MNGNTRAGLDVRSTMRRTWMIVVLAGCGGGRTSVPASVPGNRAPPAGPAEIVVEIVDRGQEMECSKHDVVIKHVTGTVVVTSETIEGECHGACTPEALAEGQKSLAEAQALVDAGETSSLLDYNFTDCFFIGADLARYEDLPRGRVALITGEVPGPHDVPNRYFRIATLDCDRLFLSETFGATYVNTWNESLLEISATATGVVVHARHEPTDPQTELYRVTFDPACTAAPAEKLGDAYAF